MQLSNEQRALLTLHLVKGIGPRLIEAILQRFGSAEEAIRAPSEDLQQVPYLGTKIAQEIHAKMASENVDAELALADRFGVRLYFLGDADYPSPLTTIATPPRILYVRGELRTEDLRAVAMVGSRACTTYGRRIAEQIAYGLAMAGWTVVSGLARGIDAMAHQGALKGKGRTLAVLAGGLSKIYPPEHVNLADEVVASGALIAETPMRVDPMAGMFPARNRIITGLCQAVVLIEAADKSGALISARHAAEQGREVFAVPGNVDSPASAGTLQLLRDGAKLVRHAEDILEDLGALAPIGLGDVRPSATPSNLDPFQQRIWEALSEELAFDELVIQLAVSAEELTRSLMMLELRKAIRRLPGNRYARA